MRAAQVRPSWCAILLISAVEGIQAQTKIFLSALLKLRIPTIIFINKIDRSGAQADELIKRVKEKLTEHIIPLYRTEHIGTKQAAVVQNHLHDPTFLQACIEQLALFDEQLLADLINLFPSNTSLEDAPLSGVVFKLEKDATGEKVAYVRVFSGSLRVRTYVNLQRRKHDGESEMYTGKIQKLHVFWEGKTVQAQQVGAGEFCKVWGLKEVKIGDVVGEWSDHIKTLHFATPQLETRIEATRSEQDHQLYQALLELAEEDPLIYVLKDAVHQTLYLRIFGEVQKEVIETMLKEHYGLDVRFSETSIVCIEKPRGTGQAIEIMGAAENPFVASVGFLVEPGPAGSGITYKSTPGALPLHFHRAIEETVRATLAQGVYGWEVTDIMVTLTHTGYGSHRQDGTKGGDFRNLVPLVL